MCHILERWKQAYGDAVVPGSRRRVSVEGLLRQGEPAMRQSLRRLASTECETVKVAPRPPGAFSESVRRLQGLTAAPVSQF
jgi:hypothetical protein